MLRRGLRAIACLEVGFMYWYVGVIVTFTTLTSRTETVLTERLDKITLNTLRRTLTAHSQKLYRLYDLQNHGNIHSFIHKNYKRDIYE